MFGPRHKRRWWPFEASVEIPLLLGFVAILGFIVYWAATRICSFSKPGRYCSWNELVLWVSDQGGWWKLLIAAALLGLLTIPDWGSDRGADGEDPPQK